MTDRPDFTSIAQAITQAHKETMEALRRCCEEWKVVSIQTTDCKPDLNSTEQALVGAAPTSKEEAVNARELIRLAKLEPTKYLTNLVSDLRTRGYLSHWDEGYYRPSM